jgi:non-ribosomal peptide synthetase component F
MTRHHQQSISMNDPVIQHIPQSHPDILYGAPQPELLREEILADLLEATAARSPEHPALIFGDRTLSYRELNAQADLAASRLIDAGVRPGQIIGLWLPRGIELLVLQAAIAKAGAAWLPVDEDTPVERLQICLDDADGAGVVSCAAFAPRLAALSGFGRPVWTAEALLAAPAPDAVLSRRAAGAPDRPGLCDLHFRLDRQAQGHPDLPARICHFLRSENSGAGRDGESDRVYQGFSVAFDMSFEEIWIATWSAPRCGSPQGTVAATPKRCRACWPSNHVTVLHAVPTLLALFEQDVPGLRMINLGGEMCPESLVARWARDGRQMFNTYGPTEATVSASLARLLPGEPVTIGTPLPNYGLLVLDAAGKRRHNGALAGPRCGAGGEIGELCITGPGVAAGYLGRPDLTAEKFMPIPGPAAPMTPPVSHRRPGAHRRRRQGAVPGPHRRPGQDPRLPGRAGRDRGVLAQPGRRRHGRGPAAQGRRHRPAGRLSSPKLTPRWSTRAARQRWPRSCRPTWSRAATKCWRRCRA